MRRNPTKIGATLLVVVLFVGLWVFFAPTKLGGSTTYTVTSGISMEPLLYKGDLAVVRSASSYKVGDIALYNSAVIDAPVLHRIYKIQNGNYYFKGDNNDFVDPGYATRAELVGKLWFRIPKVGGFISWFGQPLHSAVLAGLAALAMMLSLGQTKKRRRRRHRSASQRRSTLIPDIPEVIKTPTSETPVPARQMRDAAYDSPMRGVRKPFHQRQGESSASSPRVAAVSRPSFTEGHVGTLVLAATFLVAAVLCLGIGLTRPLKHDVSVPNAYQVSGNFSYSAVPTSKTQVYPSGKVSTGDPIYSSLVKKLTVKFNYKFTSSLPHKVNGTIELRALVLSQTNTWQAPYVLKPKTTFLGDSTTQTSTILLSNIYKLVDSVNTQTGAAGTSYTADLQPVVHIRGTVGGKHVNETFAPVLPFSITQAAITLNVAVTPAPPGATYVAPTVASQLALTLHPSLSGTVDQSRTNSISVARYTLDISFLRFLGGIFLGLALLALGWHETLRRRMTGRRRSAEEVMAKQLHLVIIPVTSLEMAAGLTPIEVPDFPHLGNLARFLERPVLYENTNGNRTYAVDDDNRRYIFRPEVAPTVLATSEIATPEVAMQEVAMQEIAVHEVVMHDVDPKEVTTVAESSAKSHRPSKKGSHRSRRVNVIQGVVGLLALCVIFTLSTSFTSSSTVSSSSAGASVQSLLTPQLEPSGCSSLNLVSLVRGSGTFSNSSSNALILGSSGNDTITDNGNHNCVVGGGGNNYVNGPSSDICITGPSLNIAGACTSPPNGVTATATTSNVTNNGGQEHLAIANTSSITAMTITISIAQTPPGVTYSSETNAFAANTITESDSTAGGVITYSYVLKSGKTIAAGTSGDSVTAVYTVSGPTHSLTGDTWSVTSTSGGNVSTISGNF
jgi:signal peptidase I